jgi:crotonobetainyl-CoA:carnitine CoA-transferase CaiB-like acyl-CoA transferase
MLAPVQSIDDLLRDRQLATRRTWRTAALKDGAEPVLIPGPPIRMSDGDWEPRGPAPALASGNEAILTELGYSDEQQHDLRSRGVI